MEYLRNITTTWQYVAGRSVKPGAGIPLNQIKICQLTIPIDFNVWEVVNEKPKYNILIKRRTKK